jgi:assimilatory nitrate reductase catalytic subunit
MLACHLDLENAEHRTAVRAFWDAPAMPDRPGLKAVDLFQAVEAGQVKALWIIHTNPAVTMPEADRVARAIENCPFVVVSDITAQTDTARLADVLLPAAGWGEKSGTVTNSDRTISRQRAALSPPGQARPDWQILSQVGKRMGWGRAFDYETPAEIFREYAALSGVARRFGRDFDISGFADLSDEGYSALAPTRWPVTAGGTGDRFFADGGFYHPDGKARLIPVRHRAPAVQPDAEYPFVLNTGRIRDQWHTMTRSGLSARLSAHLAEPFVDIHPQDALDLGLAPADLAELHSPTGRGIFRVRMTEDVRRGQLFAPIHWTGETAPSARVDALVPAVTDPISGQPESKATRVSVTRLQAAWYGFAISTRPLAACTEYWAVARTENGYRTELAGCAEVEDWDQAARGWFGLAEAELVSASDPKRGVVRLAFVRDNKVLGALFVAREPVAIMRDYLSSLPDVTPAQVLAGRAPGAFQDPGPTICACFGVGVNTIMRSIQTGEVTSLDDLGKALHAGTNCGACKPELAKLLRTAGPRARPSVAETG